MASQITLVMQKESQKPVMLESVRLRSYFDAKNVFFARLGMKDLNLTGS